MSRRIGEVFAVRSKRGIDLLDVRLCILPASPDGELHHAGRVVGFAVLDVRQELEAGLASADSPRLRFGLHVVESHDGTAMLGEVFHEPFALSQKLPKLSKRRVLRIGRSRLRSELDKLSLDADIAPLCSASLKVDGALRIVP